MPTQMFMWIILTILILSLVYYRLYITEDGKVLATLSLLGSAIGFSAAIAVLHSNSIYIQGNLMANLIFGVWALVVVLISITFMVKRQGVGLTYVNSIAGRAELLSKQSESGHSPGLIEQSVEALNTKRYDQAIDLLEKAIDFSEDLGTELKLRTELAFAYQLTGENDLAKEQLQKGMQIAQELGDSWVYDLTNAVDKLHNNPAVKI